MIRSFLFECLINLKALYNNYDRFRSVFPYRANLPQRVIREFDERRFREFLVYAERNFPFWKDRFKRFSVDVKFDEISLILEKLPTLTKSEVLANKSKFRLPFYKRLLHGATKAKTGGSTGEGMVFYTSRKFRRLQWNVWMGHWIVSGIPIDTNKIWVGGKTIFPNWYENPFVYSFVSRTLYLNIYKLNHLSSEDLLRLVERYEISWIHGYPSTVTLLFEKYYCLFDKIKHVTVSSETLSEAQEEFISSRGINLINHYGMSEGVINLSRISKGNWCSDNYFAYPYFNKSNGLVKAVGTNYSNKCFPLIKYSVNDQLILKNGDIVSVQGRDDEYIILKNGEKLTRLDHLFKASENIFRAQIVQNSLNEVIIRLDIKGSADRSLIEKEILSNLKRMTTLIDAVRFEYTSNLELTTSGKFKMVINRINEADSTISK